MPSPSRGPVWGQVHLSRRTYQAWAATVASLAKTPRSLLKPRSELSDLELTAAVIKEHRSDLVQLWETFTTERADVSRYLMDPKRESLVYLLGFHLSNQARAQGVMQRLAARTSLFTYLSQAQAPIHLIDLGCGTGALSLTAVEELKQLAPEAPLSVELVDKSQPFLEAATHGLKAWLGDEALTTRRQKLDEYFQREAAQGARDGLTWYQLGYVWNEIAHQAKTTQLLLKYLDAGLKKGKRLITLIEPATQDLARAAMELRDELVERGYRVLYPCPHQEACPMLERSRDWCYSEFAWERPPLSKVVDKILKVERHRLGASAYIFASPDLVEAMAALDPVAATRPQAVVVGRPLDPSDRRRQPTFEYLLCTPGGLVKEKPGEGPELLRGQTTEKPAPRKKSIDTAPGKVSTVRSASAESLPFIRPPVVKKVAPLSRPPSDKKKRKPKRGS